LNADTVWHRLSACDHRQNAKLKRALWYRLPAGPRRPLARGGLYEFGFGEKAAIAALPASGVAFVAAERRKGERGVSAAGRRGAERPRVSDEAQRATEDLQRLAPERPLMMPERPPTMPEPPRTTPEPPRLVPEAPRVAPEAPRVTPERPRVAPELPGVAPERPRVAPEPPRVTENRVGAAGNAVSSFRPAARLVGKPL